MDGTRAPADWKVGVDIGGTFMDFCALDTTSGRIASLKVLTTPDDPGPNFSLASTFWPSARGSTLPA